MILLVSNFFLLMEYFSLGTNNNHNKSIYMVSGNSNKDLDNTELLMPSGVQNEYMEVFNRSWGGSNDESSHDIALDLNGNIYISGMAYNDIILLKYSPSGNLLWNRSWGGSGNDYGEGVTLDKVGNIYVCGYSNSYTASTDVILLKYDSSGNLLWNTTWGGSSTEYAISVASDDISNIYITGRTQSYGAGLDDIFILKYNSSGNLLWSKTWGLSSFESAKDISIGENNDLYITGVTSSFGAGLYDIVLLKYDLNGNLLWNRTWGGSGNDYGNALCLNGNNIYITGYTKSFGALGKDVCILAYNTSGNLLWNSSWGILGDDDGVDIKINSQKDILVSTTTNNFVTSHVVVGILKLNQNGILLWNNTFENSVDIYPNAMAINSSSNDLFIVGDLDNTATSSYDVFLMRFTIQPPEAPQLLSISPNPSTTGNITLDWNNVENADYYLLYRDTQLITQEAYSSLTYIANISASLYVDRINSNGTYYYAVVAVRITKHSNISNCQSVTVSIPPATNNTNDTNNPESLPIWVLILLLIIGTLIMIVVSYFVVVKRGDKRGQNQNMKNAS
ncbi:MAG: SBBP repeat-containing protein [Promethearchaeota archaeon]